MVFVTFIFYRDELQIVLRTVLNVLDGCDSVLPFWDEPAIKIKPFESFTEQFNPINGVTGEIKMPDGSNVRLFMVRLMTELQEVMLTNEEHLDDTKSLTILQLVSQCFLFYPSINYQLWYESNDCYIFLCKDMAKSSLGKITNGSGLKFQIFNDL